MEKKQLLSINERMRLTQDWYCVLEVLFKMVDYTKSRESVFLISKAENPKHYFYNTRYLRIECVRDFNYLLQAGLHMFDENRLYNLYYSVAKFKQPLPFWTFNGERKQLIAEWVKFRMLKDVESYDFFIDVDCDKNTFEGGKITVRKVMELFNKYKLPYEIRTSGKGFHIIVDGKVFNILGYDINEDLKDCNNLCHIFGNIAKKMNVHISNLIDDGVYDFRRVTKIPYSLVHYVDEVRVAFPFESLSEFENYQYDDGKIQNFIKKLRDLGGWDWRHLLRSRETFIFNKGSKPNVKGFIDDVLKWES